MQRTKNGLAVFSATMRLCKECWNWAPTVCAFFTFLCTTTRLSARMDWWLAANARAPLTTGTEPECASFSCDADDDDEASDKLSDAELDEPAYASRPASVLTESRFRQFFDGRALSFANRFFLASLPLSPDKLSLPS